MEYNIRHKEFKQDTSEALDCIFASMNAYVIPLFHNDKPEWQNSPPELIGTGVLIAYKEMNFLVSAAHVLQPYATKGNRNPYREEDTYDEPDEVHLSLNNIGFYFNDCYYPVQHVIYTTLNGSVENCIDLAIMPLEEETVKELSPTKLFVAGDMIELNHQTSTESRYLVYGYPAVWTDLEVTSKIIKSRPLKMITSGVDSSAVTKLRFYQKYNLLVKYNPKTLIDLKSGTLLEFDSPNGISGCGLWYYGIDNRPVLVGIMIENKLVQEKQPIMMATRIDEVINIIDNYILTRKHNEQLL